MRFIKSVLTYGTDKSVFFLFFAYTFFVRFPFFFRDYIDRDESSFILVGQSWVDGYLPYTQLWDIKPPLIFFVFASVIYFFGKSFFAIRLLGVLLVAISSFFTYKITERICSRNLAFFIGLLCIILQSLFGSLQGVMSEHIAMAFLVPAIYILTKKNQGYFPTFLAGILVGCSLMTKLNLAYVALFVGFSILFFNTWTKQLKKRIVLSIFYGAGILVVIGTCFLPYFLEGEGMLWWNSVIKAPLAYAGARQDSPLRILFYLMPILLLLVFGWKKGVFDFKNKTVAFLLIIVLGTLYTFYKGGRLNGHYLILIYPFILPLLAIVLDRFVLPLLKKPAMVVLIVICLVPMESYKEYYAIANNAMQKGTLYNGEGVDVPKYLKSNQLSTDNILFTEFHIGYWVLDVIPPTKAATQPSNILKDEMFFAYDNPRKTAGEELQYIMEHIRPSLVVTRKGRRIFDKKNYAANLYMELQLLKNYTILDTIDTAIIYQRLKLE